MGKLAPISQRKLVSRLRRLGFDGPVPGGRHPVMRRGDITVVIPNPHEADIGPGLLSQILRDGGVTRKEWESTN
jgi:predicted RNA binding protein YcfA (HicA-like mRNA interferase family)